MTDTVENPKPPRECNRHKDCDKADAEVAARKIWIRGVLITEADHCHDECCEECFGN